VYCDPPPEDLPLEEVMAAVGELIADGTVRAWAIVNWPAERIAQAGRIARDQGVPAPCAAQLPYSLVSRLWVEGPEMTEALRLCDARVVASFVLAGGALTGKYATPGATGRLAGELDTPRFEAAVAAVEPLRALAADLGATPAALAMAFALANGDVACILFGATTREQVRENVRAAELASVLSASQLADLRAIGAS
jgi:aryl-alcohol dehydrogenase-like predicted oxidoreductase